MPDTVAQSFDSLSEAELKQLMSTMQTACDVVRIVNPSTFEARTFDNEADELRQPYRCYSAICHDRRCENCISMRAVDEHRPVSKFEFVDGSAYFITARPISFEGKPHTLEVVQKVSDDVGLQDGLHELQEQVQEKTDREFIDSFTGAYTRKYFDEGLQSMQGRKLAIVKVENLASINETDGYPAGDLVLKRIAHEILANTRIEDSVVHYKGNKFAVQFEDVDTEEFPAIIYAISEAVNEVVIDTYPHLHPMCYIAAVDEDATYGELAEKALELLAQAERDGQRIVMKSSDAHHQAAAAVRLAAASESLQQPSEKLMAEADELTGLHTATFIRSHLLRLVGERHAHSDGYYVVYFDIENFKQFNRTYGRPGGNMLLQFVADRIREQFPEGMAARITGDVFIVVSCEPDVAQRIERIHEAVNGYQHRIALELKAGVANLDKAAHDPSMLIDSAKVACESIKGRYDRAVRFYDNALEQEISMAEYVVNNLDRAIAEGHITVFFQPIIRTMTGHVCGYECLCRWEDPDHGLLAPQSFIPALERFHLINKVDACVVRQACQHQAELLALGKPIVPASVNLSRLDFQLDDIFAVVEQAVADAGIPRNMLIIEVTESALDDDADFFASQVDKFREAGYEVWMDDFGSGYSTLNLLKDYRFDTLKIDMAFLAGFDKNPKSREIIVTIVDMAKKLGIRTLIEGVETKQQYRFLQRIGCEMLQGFYFGRPSPYDADAFSEHVLEDERERVYFDRLGSVNLLGLPSDDESTNGGNVTESESRSAPMALVEYRKGCYRYLSTNEAYLKIIEALGEGTFDEVQEVVADGGYGIGDELSEQLDDTRSTGRETVRQRNIANAGYQIHVRHIATGPDAHAYVVIPVVVG